MDGDGPNDDGHVMMQALARGVSLVLTEQGEVFYRRLRPTDAPSVSSAGNTKPGLEARLWVLEQLARTLRQRGTLTGYRVPLDAALERVASEARERYPNVVVHAGALARAYAGYPWVRTGRRVRRRLTAAGRQMAGAFRPVAAPAGLEPEEIRFGLDVPDTP